MVQGYASKHRKWMTAGIFILLYSVPILLDSSLFTKPHLPRYYAYIRYHVKTEIFLSIASHSFLYFVLKLPLINWMVQRTSLMKPWGAKELDKAAHKSGSLYACLINRETIKLKTSYIISNQVRNKLQIIDCLRFVLAFFQDRKFFFCN